MHPHLHTKNALGTASLTCESPARHAGEDFG